MPEGSETNGEKEHGGTEGRNPAAARLDELSAREIAALMNGEDATVTAAVGREVEAIGRAIELIATRLRDGGRLIYVGAGTSGRLGVLDASECPPTFGTPPGLVLGLIAGGERSLTSAQEGAEDRAELAHADLDRVALTARDVVVGISASGKTPYVLAAIARAAERGAATVGLSCNRGSPLSTAAQLAITPESGPEIVAGSTRLKAGTATKLVLNMLSTGAMVRLGRVRGNLMVDLRPGSAKLEQRAAAIVAELANVDEARAKELLVQHGGSARAAIDAARARKPAAESTRPAVPLAPSRFVLGIDGGGTKTAARLAAIDGSAADAPRETAIETLHAACNLTTDFEGALGSIRRIVAQLFATAGVAPAPLAALAIACAGSGDAALRDRLRRELERERIAARLVVVHDAAPLLCGGTREGVGVALIAGTGSLAFGRDASGRCARSGGLGPLLGDEGSGYALGLAALKAAARAADGRAMELPMTRRLLAEIGTRDPRSIAQIVADAARTPAQIARFAPLVSAAAEAGDVVALRLLERAAAELALMVKTVVRRLELPARALPLVLAGGLFDHDARQRQRVIAALRSLGVTPDVQPAVRATEGAVAIARAAAAGRFDEASWFPTS